MGNIYTNGIHQSDLYTMLSTLVTNFNAMCTELTTDTDRTLTGPAYDITLDMGGYKVSSGTGLGQNIVYLFLEDLETKWNLVMAQLDISDLTDANYVTLCGLTTIMDDNTESQNIRSNGMFQGSLVWFLDHIITQLATLDAKLDADGSALCAGYAAAYDITDTIDTTGTARTHA